MGAPKRGNPQDAPDASAHLGRAAEKTPGGPIPAEPLGRAIRRFFGGPLRHRQECKTTGSQAN